MAWRKWFVRSVVFGVLGGCAVLGWLYQEWTNPAAVREQVLRRLQTLFPGAAISVDQARLRLLGGIQLRELRMVRHDDAERVDFAQVPSAVVYHDKEKLLEGELSLRKVELHRPRIRAYRNADGTWNLSGILGQPRLDRYLPQLIIHQGTLLLEDRTTAGNISSLEITDLHLILINDPLPTLKFEGSAQSPLVGKVKVAGSLQRATNEARITVTAEETPLTAKLLQRVAPWCPTGAIHQVEVSGRVDVEANLHLEPQKPMRYDVTCRVRNAGLRHPAVPLPMEKIQARVRIADGQVTLEEATAVSGSATFTARAAGRLPCLEEDFEAHVKVQRLTATEEMVGKLPTKLQELYHLYRPEGELGVEIDVARHEGDWATLTSGGDSVVRLTAQHASAVFQKFQYPVREVAGSVEYDLRKRETTFSLEGRASDRPLKIRGSASGSGKDLELKADLEVAGLPLNETLLAALPTTPQKLARSFHAEGRVDVVARLRHVPGVAEFDNRFEIVFQECKAAWDAFPLALSGISGRLDILGPRTWRFQDFRARHGGGTLAIEGESFEVPGQEKPGVVVRIQADKLPLDEGLGEALAPMPAVRKAWDLFRPSGAMSFLAVIHRPTEELDDLEVRVHAQGATVTPVFLPHRFDGLEGLVHYQKSRLSVAYLSARHGATQWVVPHGEVELRPGGGYHAKLPLVDVENLVLDGELLAALPEALRQAGEALHCRSPLRVRSELIVHGEPGRKPDLYWNAQAWLTEANLNIGVPVENTTGVLACRGRHDGTKLLGVQGNVLLEQAILFGQAVGNVQATFEVDEKTPDLLVAKVKAPTYGGDIVGEVRVEFPAGERVRYEINLTASQIDLEQFGRKNFANRAKMEGKAVGRLHLVGTSGGIDTLDGDGSFDVWNGRLENLPLLLDLLKFLNLRWPDRTAFEEVHAEVRIQGRRVRFRRLELQGNAISLTGHGDFKLDGSDLALDFVPTWARIEQILPPALRPLPPALSKQFLVIEMRGKVGPNPDDLKFHKRPIPVLIDPLLYMRDRVRAVTPEAIAGRQPAVLRREP